MRIPDFLKPGGSVGFAAPSFGCSIEPYKSAFVHALENWQKLGYERCLGPNVYKSEGIGISASPESCGHELTQMYLTDLCDVLISCGGGELMCETLDYVDFDRIKAASPKWYLGYSDNTNFIFLLATICDTAAIYGPCAPAFGMEPWHEAISDVYQLLTGKKKVFTGYPLYEEESLKDEENPLEPYHVTQPRVIRRFLPERQEDTAGTSDNGADNNGILTENEDREVLIEGRLIGGCMDCLVNLLGTNYDNVAAFNEKYQKDGMIWFLESCDLNVFAIRRAIWQMQHAGWFKYVRGFLIGRPLVHGQEMMGLDQYKAVTDLLAQYQVPVIMDLDIGHIPPMMPIVSGAYAKIYSQGQDFSIEYDI